MGHVPGKYMHKRVWLNDKGMGLQRENGTSDIDGDLITISLENCFKKVHLRLQTNRNCHLLAIFHSLVFKKA